MRKLGTCRLWAFDWKPFDSVCMRHTQALLCMVNILTTVPQHCRKEICRQREKRRTKSQKSEKSLHTSLSGFPAKKGCSPQKTSRKNNKLFPHSLRLFFPFLSSASRQSHKERKRGGKGKKKRKMAHLPHHTHIPTAPPPPPPPPSEKAHYHYTRIYPRSQKVIELLLLLRSRRVSGREEGEGRREGSGHCCMQKVPGFRQILIQKCTHDLRKLFSSECKKIFLLKPRKCHMSIKVVEISSHVSTRGSIPECQEKIASSSSHSLPSFASSPRQQIFSPPSHSVRTAEKGLLLPLFSGERRSNSNSSSNKKVVLG